MKKFLPLLSMLAFAGIVVAGCSADYDDYIDEQPEEEPSVLAVEAAGTYICSYAVTVYGEYPTRNEGAGEPEEDTEDPAVEVRLVRTDDNQVKLDSTVVQFPMIEGFVTAILRLEALEEIDLSGEPGDIAFEEEYTGAALTFNASIYGGVDIPVDDARITVRGNIGGGNLLELKLELASRFIYDLTGQAGSIGRLEITFTGEKEIISQ